MTRLRRVGSLAAALLVGPFSLPGHAGHIAAVSAGAGSWCTVFFLVGDCLPVAFAGGVELVGGAVPGVMWCSVAAPGAVQVSVTCVNGNGESTSATSVGSAAVASTVLADNFPSEPGSRICIYTTATWPPLIGGTKSYYECFDGHLVESP